MKKNLQHIDEIRFLVIHMILVNHWLTNIYITKKGIDASLIDFTFEITSPLLSMISGYLFFYRTKEQFNFVIKLKARFHSLVIPYIVWTAAFFLIFFIMKEIYLHVFHTTYWYGPIVSINVSNLVSTFVNPPLINFWYLQNLILIIPFNFIFYYLLKNRYVFILFFIFVIAVYSFNWFNIYFQPRFLPYYLVGCFLGFNEKHLPAIKLSKIATVVLIPVLFFAATGTNHLDYANFFIILLKIVIALLFVICLFNMIDSNMNSWIVTYLRNNKGYSFFVFAIHMFLYSLVQRALLRIGLENFVYNKYYTLLFNLLSFSLVLAIALLMARFLKSRFSKFYYFITGR